MPTPYSIQLKVVYVWFLPLWDNEYQVTTHKLKDKGNTDNTNWKTRVTLCTVGVTVVMWLFICVRVSMIFSSMVRVGLCAQQIQQEETDIELGQTEDPVTVSMFSMSMWLLLSLVDWKYCLYPYKVCKLLWSKTCDYTYFLCCSILVSWWIRNIVQYSIWHYKCT